MHILTCTKPTALDHCGRNGYVKSGGISVLPFKVAASDNPQGEVIIEPLNSRGEISKGQIIVHVDLIDDLIAALQAAKIELKGE